MSTSSEDYRDTSTWLSSVSGLVYPELVQAGFSETLVQNTNVFNAASNNAIQIVPEFNRGDFLNESFFKSISDLVTRRNVGSVSPGNDSVTPKSLSLGEFVSPLINRRIGPVQATLESFRKLGMGGTSPEEISLALGEQVAKAVAVDYLNTGLEAIVAATRNQAAMSIDIGSGASPQRNLTSNDLVDTLAQFGDASSRVVVWVMHSTVFFSLVKSQITANIDGISNFALANGSPTTLGIPVLVTDDDALFRSGSPGEVTEYTTLGLTAEAVQIFQAPGAPLIDFDTIHGNENLVVSMQGEHEYNLKVKGYQYDVANGGVNPTDAVIGTGSNWDKVATSNKDLGACSIDSLG
ncbi:MAG: major capsid protein [Pseudomonadaceae bacterium]|nr:major capsid protein [Pseudomonadaceae bacterium]